MAGSKAEEQPDPYVVRIGGKADRRSYLIIFGICIGLLALIAAWWLVTRDVLLKEAVACAMVGLWALYMLTVRVASLWTIDAAGLTIVRTGLFGGRTQTIAVGDIDYLTLEPHKALGHDMATVVFRLRTGRKVEIIGKHGLEDVNLMRDEIKRRLPQLAVR